MTSFLDWFANALGTAMEFFSPIAGPIEIVQDDDTQLWVQSNSANTVLHLRSKSIRQGSHTRRFSDVKAVYIQRGGTEDTDEWSVVLLMGNLGGIAIGTTHDDSQASVAAARLSTVLGVQIVT